MSTQRNSQAQKALMGLRSLVLSGEIAPGARLSEPMLADRLGISRTPLRAALAQLVDEGLVERIETGGCRVRRFGFQDIADAIELRGVMEGTALRLAAERGPDPQALTKAKGLLVEIDQAIGADEQSVDFEDYATLNAAFHHELSRCCRSETVRREVDRAVTLPLAGPSAFLQSQAGIPQIRRSLFVAQAQHRSMVAALEAGEGTRAEMLAREHARLAQVNLGLVLAARGGVHQDIPGLALVSDAADLGKASP